MKTTTKIILLSGSMVIGVGLGSNLKLIAQTGHFPCGQCNMERYTEFLGSLGFCEYVIPGVYNVGCAPNNGSTCSNASCNNEPI